MRTLVGAAAESPRPPRVHITLPGAGPDPLPAVTAGGEIITAPKAADLALWRALTGGGTR